MSKKETPAAEAAPDTAAPAAETSAPSLRLRVKVLVSGIKIARGTAAAGKILTVPRDVAVFHESRKEVKILGTA